MSNEIDIVFTDADVAEELILRGLEGLTEAAKLQGRFNKRVDDKLDDHDRKLADLLRRLDALEARATAAEAIRAEKLEAIRARVAEVDPKPTPDELDPSILVVRNARTGAVSYEAQE